MTWARIDNEESGNKALSFLNQQNKKIEFTMEKEKKEQLPFLDTVVNRRTNTFTTNIYHKPTFTGVYLNWTSLTSRKYTISLIYCLCNRIWKLCQDKDVRELELKKPKCILVKNEYPEKVIEKEIEKFIKKQRTSGIHPRITS